MASFCAPAAPAAHVSGRSPFVGEATVRAASAGPRKQFLGEGVSQKPRRVFEAAANVEVVCMAPEPDAPPQRPSPSGPPKAPVSVPTVFDVSSGKAMDLWTRLLRDRVVFLGGSIDDTVSNAVVTQLMYLASQDSQKDIKMYVNSPGGSVTAGMAMFDTMNYIKPDVSTICFGLAASMGAFLLSAGKKGKRYSLPHSRIMIHQPLGGAQGQATDVKIQAKEILYHKRRLSELMAEHTSQPLEKILADTERDKFMSPTEAKEYGLIDDVLPAKPRRGHVPDPKFTLEAISY
eukprot:tig00020553_g10691.t1